MAQLYTIVYSYTGKDYWSKSDREVSWDDFTATGDTDKTILHVESVEYEHFNNSYKDQDWNLRGGLVLEDNSVVYSNEDERYIPNNTETIKFTNSFTGITAEQLSSIKYVRTYAEVDGEWGYTRSHTSSILTWTASVQRPIRIIVTFYDEDPLKYKPTIEKFEVARGSFSGDLQVGTRDDSGGTALYSMKLSVAKTVTDAEVSIKLYYAEGTRATTMNLVRSWGSLTSGFTNGYTDIGLDTTDYPAVVLSKDKDYRFRLIFTYGDGETTETAIADFDLSNTFVSLHIAPYITGGVSIGDISTSSEGVPKFEVHHPVYLYGGIAQIGKSDGTKSVLAAMGIQAGAVAPVSLSSQLVKTGTVTFESQFASVPTIATAMTTDTNGTGITNYYAGECCLYIRNVSTTGFDYMLVNGRTASRTIGFNWIALGSSGGIVIEADWQQAPTNLRYVQSDADEQSVTLYWSHGSEDVMYIICEEDGTIIGYTDICQKQYVLTNLDAGTHTYKVAAYKNGLPGEYTPIVITVAEAAWMTAPVVTKAYATGFDIYIEWTHAAENVDYYVQDNNSIVGIVSSDGSGTYSLTIPTSEVGEHTLYVWAVKDDDYGNSCDTIYVTVESPDVWKTAPTNVTATQINTETEYGTVYLSWEHVSSNVQYIIYDERDSASGSAVGTTDVGARSMTIAGVGIGNHIFVVQPYDGTDSGEVGFADEIYVFDYTMDNQATDFEANIVEIDTSAGTASVKLTWKHPSPYVSFTIAVDDEEYTTIAEGGSRYCIVQNLTRGQTYKFALIGKAATGSDPYHEPIEIYFTIPASDESAEYPDPPLYFTATRNGSYIDFSWAPYTVPSSAMSFIGVHSDFSPSNYITTIEDTTATSCSVLINSNMYGTHEYWIVGFAIPDGPSEPSNRVTLTINQ